MVMEEYFVHQLPNSGLKGAYHTSPSRLPDDENECDFPYYFVGDEAFPLARYLMRPFHRRTLDNTKKF